MQPRPGDDAFYVINLLDHIYLTIFTCELLANMFCNWWKKFCDDAWLRFDFMVVMLSLVQIVLDAFITSNVPGIKQLRVLRTFRIIKAFGRFKELKKIIHAVCASVGPVGHATVITGNRTRTRFLPFIQLCS